MNFNQFEYYTKAVKSSTQANRDYNSSLELITRMEECTTITSIKSLLKNELGITECVDNFPIGNLGFLSIKDNSEKFELNIHYSNQVRICVFPKGE